MSTETLQIVPAEAVEPGGRALDRVFEGESAGVCVRGFLSPAEVEAWLRCVERGDLPEPTAPFLDEGGVRIVLHGPMLEQSPDVSRYCELAARWRNASPDLPPELQPASVERRFRECVSSLSSKPVECLALDGQLASHGSLRFLGEGGFIGAHFELAMLRTPYVLHTVAPLIEADTVLSYLLPLSIPAVGGRLELFDLRPGDLDESIVYDRYAMRRVDVDALEPHPVALEPGDLLVFDSGRIFHHVSRTEAPPWRWTFGGFMARMRGGERVWYWG